VQPALQSLARFHGGFVPCLDIMKTHYGMQMRICRMFSFSLSRARSLGRSLTIRPRRARERGERKLTSGENGPAVWPNACEWRAWKRDGPRERTKTENLSRRTDRRPAVCRNDIVFPNYSRRLPLDVSRPSRRILYTNVGRAVLHIVYYYITLNAARQMKFVRSRRR